MATNKTLTHTNFSGIKYSNNPLTVDPNSFSHVNNVYLNKYNALISRPPINAQDYPAAAYGANLADLIPEHLKLVGLYDLSNGGVVYIVFNTNTELYTLRYKSPLDEYINIMTYDSTVSV